MADESVLAHFESLELEMVCFLQRVKSNSSFGSILNLEQCDNISSICQVPSQLAEDNALKDSEKDGNEMPLGRMIKNIKSQGTKGKKMKKNKTAPAETKKAENDIDILNMVREINLDNLGISTNFESSNGHENSLSKKAQNDPESTTTKKRKVGEASSVPVPKRKRTSFTHGKLRPSSTSKAPQRVSGVDSSRVKSTMDAEFNPDTDRKTTQRKMVKSSEHSLKPKAKAFKSYHNDEADKSDEHDPKVKFYCQVICTDVGLNSRNYHHCRLCLFSSSVAESG